jgi:hypothetical protein
MMQSNLQRSGLGLLVVLFFLLFSSAVAWGDQHEKKEHKASTAHTKETKHEKVLRLAHELKALLERGDLDGGGDVYSSDVYFRVVDGNMQDALETAGDFEPSSEGAQILARLDEILRKLRRIYDQG